MLYIRHQTQIPLHLRVLDLEQGRKIAKSLQEVLELKPYLKCVILDKFFQPVHDKEMPYLRHNVLYHCCAPICPYLPFGR